MREICIALALSCLVLSGCATTGSVVSEPTESGGPYTGGSKGYNGMPTSVQDVLGLSGSE